MSAPSAKGSRNENRVMAIKRVNWHHEKILQEVGISGGLQDLPSRQTLLKSFQRRMRSIAKFAKSLTLLTILKTRPKQLDFKLKIEQNQQQQQQQKTIVQYSGTRQRGEEPRWHYASIRSVTQTANNPQGCHCHCDTATRPSFAVASRNGRSTRRKWEI